jgi:hypothetical protein
MMIALIVLLLMTVVDSRRPENHASPTVRSKP